MNLNVQNLNIQDYKKYFSPDFIWWGIIFIFILSIIVEWISLLSFIINPTNDSSKIKVVVKNSINEIEHELHFKMFGDYLLDQRNMKIESSRLNIQIVGIMYSTRPSLSQVVIQLEDGTTKIYRQGDSIGFNLLLKQIEAESIVVNNNGHLERLNLPKMELRFEAKPSPLNMQDEY